MKADVIRGASVSAMAEPKLAKHIKATELGASLQRVKPYLGLLGAMLMLVLLYAQKSHLIALVDHQISEISVSGELNKLSSTEVSTALQPWLGSSFLTADLDAIKVQVQSLPWVHHSEVARVWPGKIVVTAVEQVPVARWNEASYLNQEGEVFTPEALDWTVALPHLQGPESSELVTRKEMLSSLADLTALLAVHQQQLLRLELKSRGVWEASLLNGVDIALGELPFEQKVTRLGEVMKGASAEMVARMKMIDTRYPNGIAIQWKNGDDQTLASN